MKFPAMFSPVEIGTVTVPNRFVVPPMGNNFANTDGSLSDRSIGYYSTRAKGSFGLISIESTVVYSEAKGGPGKPCLFTDKTVPGFKAAADACHQYGAKVSIQLQHAGPEGNSKLTGFPLKAASPIPAAEGREVPEAIGKEEFYRLIECYGDAARRAQMSGIDTVEVHCAHGYLVSTFISSEPTTAPTSSAAALKTGCALPDSSLKTFAKRPAETSPSFAASTPATRFPADRPCRMRRRWQLT